MIRTIGQFDHWFTKSGLNLAIEFNQKFYNLKIKTIGDDVEHIAIFKELQIGPLGLPDSCVCIQIQ